MPLQLAHFVSTK